MPLLLKMKLISMNEKVVVDSYVWMEYFRGTKRGEIARDYIENGSTITPVIVIAELSAKYHREKWKYWKDDFEYILATSTVVPLDIDIANKAGKTRFEMRKTRRHFGLADAITLETAKARNLRLLSGDPHFKGLKDVIYIG